MKVRFQPDNFYLSNSRRFMKNIEKHSFLNVLMCCFSFFLKSKRLLIKTQKKKLKLFVSHEKTLFADPQSPLTLRSLLLVIDFNL